MKLPFISPIEEFFARNRRFRRSVIPLCHFSASIRYKLIVQNPDGTIAEERPFKRNLILDQGLNYIGNQASWCGCIANAVVGTGTTAVRKDSGATTLSMSASNHCIASAGFFAAGDVGAKIKFNSGEEVYITAFNSNTDVTCDQTLTVAAVAGTVWYVAQTGLTAETKRTNSLGTDSGDNGSTWASPTWTHKKTFIFSAEGAPITYNELGWSYTNAAGANLFGRDLITGGIALGVAQQLKVVLNLQVTLSPVGGATVWTNTITGGFGGNGHIAVEDNRCVSRLDTSGNLVTTFASLEPTVATPGIQVATDSTALVADPATGHNLTGNLNAASGTAWAAYTPGNFYRDASVTFAVTEGNSTTLRSLGITISNSNNLGLARILLDANATKDSSHTLQMTWRISWSRTLVN